MSPVTDPTTSPGLRRDVSASVELLRAAPLFSSFEDDELAAIAEKSDFLELADGQVLFQPGDPGDRLFMVASGSIVIFSPESGQTLAEFVPGDSFGELELLTRAARNALARSSGPSRLLAFPSGGLSIQEALSARPAVATRILRSFLIVVAGRTRSANALVKENSPVVRELKRQVYGDKLTGLYNKAYLDENLPGLVKQGALALVMMKPDNFKEINDRFGHEAGDATLVLMAGELARHVGAAGTCVRYMGNELAVVYPGLDREAAIAAARGIQAHLSGLDLEPVTKDGGIRLSMSLGIALAPEHGAAADLIKVSSGLPLEGRARGGSKVLFPEDIA